jgi:hypothetical protein
MLGLSPWEDVSKLQECYDAMTRATREGKALACELLQVGGDGVRTVVDNAFQVGKSLVEPTEAIERLMFKTREEMNPTEVTAALKMCATPFARMEKLLGELRALHRHHIGGAKSRRKS